jgi:Leucine-rich repeat (LRR) protein
LQKFNCSLNKITQIPDTLPDSLQEFSCHHNQIIQIPNTLPNSLQNFDCRMNQITQIPDTLPNSLKEFWCSYNQITHIPLSIINLQKLTNFYYNNTNIYKPPLVKYFLDNVYDTKIKKHCYNLMWKIRMEY